MRFATVLGTALLLACAASAVEYVQNGDFETGAFAPQWTQFGDTGFTSVSSSGSHGGTYHGQFGPLTPGGIQQTLAGVTAGETLNVSFWYYAGSAGTGDFMSADIGGNTFFNVATGPTGWTQYTTTVTAAAANPMLTFTFQNNPSYWHLDDVSVTPEPASLLLLGLAAVALRRR